MTQFLDAASAGTSAITAHGSTVAGGGGGTVGFSGNSSAGSATLTLRSGSNGGGGGRLFFSGNATGGSAHVAVESGGLVDRSDLSASGLTTGSLEGEGTVFLGGKRLTLGNNGRASVFSGVIADGGISEGVGGSLTKVGTGALTLTGANTYTGGTLIGNGITANSGKLIAANLSGSATGTGPVTVRRGGTLSGSGDTAGPVTLHAGGAIVPGDPVTLTLGNDLTWDGGSFIRLALGPDQAGSDRLNIGGAFIRGDTSGGAFTFELQDFGAVVGQTYDFLHFSSIQDFTAADFTFTGVVTGNLFIDDGNLGVVVTSVPEPGGIWLLCSASTLLLGLRRRHPRGHCG